MKCEGSFERIIAVVRRVPRGRIASYGQIAQLAGAGCHARLVGYALASLPEGSKVPWQRIVNHAGRISLPGPSGELQRLLLEAEGVRFDSKGKIDLARHGWRGQRPRRPFPGRS
jgi:methylated-DNA-protein-cysteine methyltransferase related protein